MEEHSRIILRKGPYLFDLERFTQKTEKGVLALYRDYITERYDPSFFLEGYFHATAIEFWSIRGEKETLVHTYTPSEFMKAIGYNGQRKKTDSEFFRYDTLIREKHECGRIQFDD